MTDIFTVFSVLIYEHDMSLHLFSPSLIFSSAFCNFQDTDPEHVFLRLYLNISFFCSEYKWYCVLNFGLCLLLEYINDISVFVCLFYICNLIEFINLLISCRRYFFFIESLEFSV